MFAYKRSLAQWEFYPLDVGQQAEVRTLILTHVVQCSGDSGVGMQTGKTITISRLEVWENGKINWTKAGNDKTHRWMTKRRV